ncbi:MAG: FAD-dependent oxidoreductase, partial [Gordonia sp. (in: high G+C Gram-positive bacteria)]|nr:FAD-dependent oxidoreductase [Gordonia sp. (in: high G+C Gram-positive bacteria)]
MENVDVIVVGAGLAGLSAARSLVSDGNSVVVLEARDRVAGRNHGGFLANGVPVELGGQWVGATQDVVLGLIDEFGLETFPTYDDGEAMTYVDGRRLLYSDGTFGLPDEVAAEVGRIWEQIEILASTVDLAKPWSSPDAETLDRQTLEQWLTG